MVTFKSAKICNAVDPNSNQDLISNLPDTVIDKILKLLPLKTVAKLSILSRRWRQIWLALKCLVFDEGFWDGLGYGDDSDKSVISRCNRIISNILLHHVGSTSEFDLYIPEGGDDLHLSEWVASLSKVEIKKIVVLVEIGYVTMPWCIYYCKELEKLTLEGFKLTPPPSHFKGFACLRSLELVTVRLEQDAFLSLIANCPQLTVFKLVQWTGMDDLVLDMPSVEHLTIEGDFDTIVFKNVQCLSFMSLCLYLEKMRDDIVRRGDEFIEMLASSCQLQELRFGGRMCEYIGTGWITAMSPTMKFLHRLHLTDVDFCDSEYFYFVLDMIQCCSNIKDLDIEIWTFPRELPRELDVDHELDYKISEVRHLVNYKTCEPRHLVNYKMRELRYLVNVKITGLKGLELELKLIEYLFSAASNLENLAFSCYELDPISEIKVTRDLGAFPRASPKAKLVCLEKNKNRSVKRILETSLRNH